jgi:hypothetical protein
MLLDARERERDREQPRQQPEYLPPVWRPAIHFRDFDAIFEGIMNPGQFLPPSYHAASNSLSMAFARHAR